MRDRGRRSRWRRSILNALAALVPPVLRVASRLLVWTLRVEYSGDAALRARWARGEQAIVAFWHDRLALVPLIASGVPMCIMVSHHRDGEMVTEVLHAWGVSTVRGSASRGAVSGFLRLVGAYRRGHNLAMLPDGPRGPQYVAKPGVVHLAKAVAAPIFPMAYAASRGVRVRSWDRLLIPLPFARLVVEVGAPLSVPPDADAQGLAHCCAALEQALNALTDSVDAKAAGRAVHAPVRVP
jgi:lysophospholipid acyltransferase (LPLAT)-like uncharacterized protein